VIVALVHECDPSAKPCRSDLDPELVGGYLQSVRRGEPQGLGKFDDRMELLRRACVITADNVPTVAGILAMGLYPQQFFPRLVIQAAGCWASAKSDAERVHRLRVPGQDLIFGRNSTLWLAAAGLSDVDPVNPADDLRGWRRRYLRFVTDAFEALARHTAKPVTVTCFGLPGRAQLAVGEAALDVFDDRARLVVVSDAGAGDLADYAADVIQCDPGVLLHAIGSVPIAVGTARRPTLPSADGPKLVPEEVMSRLGDSAQLLHSEVGVENDSADTDIGAFYRGRPISWFELDLDLDVPRKVTDDLLVRVTDALDQRDTLRITLGHSPGAGGTTVARRIAWRVKDTYPTVVIRAVFDDAVLAGMRPRSLHVGQVFRGIASDQLPLPEVLDIRVSSRPRCVDS
jgi:hypothetical protein